MERCITKKSNQAVLCKFALCFSLIIFCKKCNQAANLCRFTGVLSLVIYCGEIKVNCKVTHTSLLFSVLSDLSLKKKFQAIKLYTITFFFVE